MSDLYVYLICSRNKDNKDLLNFKKRAKTILEYKENEDRVIKEFHRFAADDFLEYCKDHLYPINVVID